MNDSIKIAAEFSPEAYATLSEIARRLGSSKSEGLRRALGALRYLLEQKEDGWRVILEKNGDRKEVETF